MQSKVLSWITTPLIIFLGLLPASGALQPATVGQNPDSFAMKLHYPAKEKAARTQGAVKFYCEVGPDGKATHISTLNNKGQGHFATAVEYALYHGRFNPAASDGKPVAVMLGGTVLFFIHNAQPTIGVVLATAEGEKIVRMSNYQQPQMLDSDALFRRKCFAVRDKYPARWELVPGHRCASRSMPTVIR